MNFVKKHTKETSFSLGALTLLAGSYLESGALGQPPANTISPANAAGELHPLSQTVRIPSRLQRYDIWRSKFEKGENLSDVPFFSGANKQAFNESTNKWARENGQSERVYFLKRAAEIFFYQENFEEIWKKTYEIKDHGLRVRTQNSLPSPIGYKVSGENVALKLKDMMTGKAGNDDSIFTVIASLVVKGGGSHDISKMVGSLNSQFVRKMMSGADVDRLGLERFKSGLEHPPVELYTSFIYDAVSRNANPTAEQKADTHYVWGGFGEGYDTAIGAHSGYQLAMTGDEILNNERIYLEDALGQKIKSLPDIKDPLKNKVAESEIEIDMLHLELLEADRRAKDNGIELSYKEVSKIYEKYRAKITPELRDAIADLNEMVKQSKLEQSDMLQQRVYKGYADFANSLSRIGQTTGSAKIQALGEIASTTVKFLDDLRESEYLISISKLTGDSAARTSGILKGLSGSIDMVTGIVSVFSMILGGGQDLDPLILDNVIELRSEVQILNQQMHYEFWMTNRHLSEIFSNIMLEFNLISKDLTDIKGALFQINTMLEEAKQLTVLSGVRQEAAARALSTELQNPGLADAIKLKGEDVSFDNFCAYLRLLSSAAADFSSNSIHAGPGIEGLKREVFFESFVRENRAARDPREIVGYLGEALKKYYKIPSLINVSNNEGKDKSEEKDNSQRKVNPTDWRFYALHYIKLKSLYPEHYEKLCQMQTSGQDPYKNSVIKAGQAYLDSLASVTHEDFKRLLKEYIHGSLKVAVQTEASRKETGYAGLSSDANWYLIGSDNANTAHTELLRAGQKLIESYQFTGPIEPAQGKPLIDSKNNLPYPLDVPDNLVKELKDNYGLYVLAEKLGLGKIKVTYESTGWAHVHEENNETPLFGELYHYMKGKLYVVLRADFAPVNSEGKVLTLFRKYKANDTEDYIGHKYYTDNHTVTPENLYYSIFNKDSSLLNPGAARHHFEELSAKNKFVIQFNMEKRGGFVSPDTVQIMTPYDGSLLEAKIREHWPKLNVNFMRDATDLENVKNPALHTPSYLPTYPPDLNPEDPEYDNYYSGGTNRHHENYSRIPDLELGLTSGPEVQKFRESSKEYIFQMLLDYLSNERKVAQAQALNLISASQGNLHSDTYEMDTALGLVSLLHQLVKPKASAEDLYFSQISDGGISLPVSEDLAYSLSQQASGKLKSLNFGWDNPAEIEDKLCRIHGEDDFNPNNPIRKSLEYLSQIDKARSEAAALREALPYVSDLLEKPSVLTDLDPAKDDLRYRFQPQDFKDLLRLNKKLSKEHSGSDLYITPRQELLLRVLVIYKSTCLRNLEPEKNTSVQEVLDELAK